MLSRTYSATTIGLNSIKIEVEVESVFGTPKLVIIGLPTRAIDEAKERITAALVACGLRIKAKRTIVNLAPADLKKTGSALELAIAVGIIKHYGLIKGETNDTIFFGELSLNGALKAIRGALPLVLAAKEMGFKQAYIPEANREEVAIVNGIEIIPLKHLRDYLDAEQKNEPLPALQFLSVTSATTLDSVDSQVGQQNFPAIIGQSQGLRALELAAVGKHNLLLVGPPGAGKSLLAQTLQKLLPPLTEKESLEVTALYSVRGLVKNGVIRHRPFRNPHHTISKIGLLGGGQSLQPGEISLAHHGVLFMDEFLEFPRQLIESLRQPLESGDISMTRSAGTVRYPAAFSLVAATNPCPCGYDRSDQKACLCSIYQKQQYLAKLSGPILDRIDLQLWIGAIKPSTMAVEADHTSQAKHWEVICNRIVAGTAFKTDRETEDYPPLIRYLSPKARSTLNTAAEVFSFTARGYYKTLAVARTVADLAQSTEITHEHLGEALQFRSTIG